MNYLVELFFHCNSLDDIFAVDEVDCKKVPKRVVFVVEERMNTGYIDTASNIVKFYCNEVDQLSFRQLIKENYQISYHLYNYLKAGHDRKDWYYIEQGDYNTYFINGDTKEKYSDLKK